MAEGGAPAGVNSAMLASMNQHDSSTSSGPAVPGTSGLGGMVGEEVGKGLKTEISLGNIGGMDSALSGLQGALEKNPFEQAFDGNQSPFGIGHPGFNANFMGNLSLSDATSVVTNLNAKVPTIASSQGQSQ